VSANHSFTRRRFLLLGAGVGAGLVLHRLPLRSGSTAFVEQRLGGLFAHIESAQAVGREYLDSVAGEADAADGLIELVVRALPGRYHTLREVSDHELRGLLAQRISEDFKEHQTVEVSGWVLARTEARLCALSALG
jgi:hypothetical protein